MASSAEMEGRVVVQSRVGRRRSTTRHQITDVAIELFAGRGFDEVSVDDVAEAAGIARRTLFRYYPSKNAIPWGDFDAHLQHLRELLAAVSPTVSTDQALRDALLSFNTFDESEIRRPKLRIQGILRTTELLGDIPANIFRLVRRDRGVRGGAVRDQARRPGAADGCMGDARCRALGL